MQRRSAARQADVGCGHRLSATRVLLRARSLRRRFNAEDRA